MDNRVWFFGGVICLLTLGVVSAGEVVIAEGKKECAYQIVTPEKNADPLIAQGISEGAEVFRQMFESNGFRVPVVAEGNADGKKRGIYLGDTAVARGAGVRGETLPVWGYAIKVSRGDVIIAGRDWVPRRAGQKEEELHSSLGTVKGIVDFLRRYGGTRFLFPEGVTGIEFLPTPRIAVPDDLEIRKEPLLQYNCGERAVTGVNLIGLNFLGNVATEYFAHTHEIAVPAEKYADVHPEYFALVGGKRIREYKHEWKGMQKEPHLCYSNKEVQELIYREMLRSLDAGFPEYLSLQADGFQPCECEACRKLFGTADWGEKLWQLNKEWGERLLKDRPGKVLNVTAYTVTGKPPSFRKFPANMRVSVGGYPNAFKTWESCEIPAGFSSYLHGWGWYHLCGYLPVRTPLYAERTVKMFARYNVRGVGLDAPPATMWGLEGPAVYTYARMIDEPQNGTAQKFVEEYLIAAYGSAAPAMRQFFEVLHHTLETYSEVFGVDNGSFQTYIRADERSVRSIAPQEKLRLIGFLYPPETLNLLERHLAQGERTAGESEKVKLRLALVRREFEYLKSTVRVVHLYQAWQVQKNRGALESLLEEMEGREKLIAGWYANGGGEKSKVGLQQPIAPTWRMFVGSEGHSQAHLLRNGGTYLAEPVPPFTWDPATIRRSAMFESPVFRVARFSSSPGLEGEEWKKVPEQNLGPLSIGGPEPRIPTSFRVASDGTALLVRFEGSLPGGWHRTPGMKRDAPDITWNESFSVVVAPDGNPLRFYRFCAGPTAGAMYDARQGFIDDGIDPRAGVDDRSWNGEWTYECALAKDERSWRGLFRVPYTALGVAVPQSGAEWRGNFGRHHFLRNGTVPEGTLWSSNPGTTSISDRGAFGVLRFE